MCVSFFTSFVFFMQFNGLDIIKITLSETYTISYIVLNQKKSKNYMTVQFEKIVNFYIE